MAFWSEGIPSGLDQLTSLVILVINIFMPGVGTILSSVLAEEFMSTTVIVGVAQLVTSIFIVGWIWAIAWSVVLYKKARDGYQPLLPQTEQQVPPQGATAAVAQ